MTESTASKLSKEQLDAILFPVTKPKSQVPKLSLEEFKKLLAKVKSSGREKARQKYILKDVAVTKTTCTTSQKTDSDSEVVSKEKTGFSKTARAQELDTQAFSFTKNTGAHCVDKTPLSNHVALGENRAKDFPRNLAPQQQEDSEDLHLSFFPVSKKRPGYSDRVFHTLFKSTAINKHEQRFVEQSLLAGTKELLEVLHGSTLNVTKLEPRSDSNQIQFSAEGFVDGTNSRIFPIRAGLSMAWVNTKKPTKVSFLTSSHADKIAQSTSSISSTGTMFRIVASLKFWANDIPEHQVVRFDALAALHIKNICRLVESVSGAQVTATITKGISPSLISVPAHIEELVDPLSELNWETEKEFREFQTNSESFYPDPRPRLEDDAQEDSSLDTDRSKKINSIPRTRQRVSRTSSNFSNKKSLDSIPTGVRWRTTMVQNILSKKLS